MNKNCLNTELFLYNKTLKAALCNDFYMPEVLI